MCVVTVSSSPSRASSLGIGYGYSTGCSPQLRRRPISFFIAFKSSDPHSLKPPARSRKQPKSAQSVSLDSASASPSLGAADVDYSEVAEALENIFKLSQAEVSDMELDFELDRMRKKVKVVVDNGERVVRNGQRRMRRLSMDARMALRRPRKEKGEVVAGDGVRKDLAEEEREEVDKLLREFSVSINLVSLDWKKMKIPPVLPLAEHKWLFKLMQPMKAMLKVKENLHADLGREPADGELAEAVIMSVRKMKRELEVGHAARQKIIKHNLRLVLFVINKHYQDIVINAQKFNDMCQAGVMGLIMAIDRFEPKRGLRLSTYALFWIRHSIVRSMTLSSFTRVSFGIESLRREIQKAKLELTFELKRLPTDEEIIERVRISPERYYDVLKATKAVRSLNGRHTITQEEFVDAVTDIDGVGGDKRKQPVLRLAIDDVLDSLKPKESLVIRQRYGLDGKGRRTLGEIAGNLNVSREMVRKHELKALMKLRHPARLDYLRRYV